MKKLLPVIALAVLATYSSAFAQKTEDKNHSFEYIRLPLKPLDKSIVNYQAQVTTSYAEEEAAKKAEYEKKLQEAEEDYKKDLELYDEQVKEANDIYNMEMEAYNEKSTGKKILEKSLLEESKPQLRLPQKPLKKHVVKPDFRKEYNTELLSSTYLKLEGYTRAEGNAVQITVTLHGFDNTEPDIKVNRKNHMSNGQSVTVETYYYSFDYRHPMTIEVEVPGKGMIYSESIADFSKYKTEKTPEYKTRAELRNKHNISDILEKTEVKILEENMKAVNEHLNSLFGYSVKKRQTVVFNVVPKKYTYDEYQKAFELALFGYNNVKSDKSAAKEKIQQAIDIWTGALKESTPSDKKSRVNNDVTVATYLNLTEAYIWLDEYEKAEESILKLTSLDPSRKERKHSESLTEILKEQKERFRASAI